jgi:predicted nucleic acid-binding Zn ribbon protein
MCGASYDARGAQKTCSEECGAELKAQTMDRLQKALHARRRAETLERREAAPDKLCKVCSAPFRPDGTDRETCSDACAHENRLANASAGKRRLRAEDPERIRATARDYRARHVDHVREYDAGYKRSWRRDNPGVEAAYMRARRAAKK